MSHKNSPQQEPHLWPLGRAAALVGLTPKLFEAAVANGDLSGVEILRLGTRGRRFVIASRVFDWLEKRGACDPLACLANLGKTSAHRDFKLEPAAAS